MDKYYYLVSQLPVLFFDRENPINIDQFLEEAEKWLSSKDYARLTSVHLTGEIPQKVPSVFALFLETDREFRRELALWRQSKREGWEYKPQSFPLSLVKEGNPLEVEKKLLKQSWVILEEQEKDHHFDLGILILYYLKLQILEKLAIFNEETGMKHFQEMSRVTL